MITVVKDIIMVLTRKTVQHIKKPTKVGEVIINLIQNSENSITGDTIDRVMEGIMMVPTRKNVQKIKKPTTK